MKKWVLAATMVMMSGGIASADTAGITISNAWSRATVTASGVVYLTVTDTGTPDTLTAAATPAAAKATRHESSMENGVMKMKAVDSLPIDKDHPITLSPKGYHLMLEQLAKPLKPGDTFPLTLTFTNAGAVITTVTVQKATAATPVPPQKTIDDMGGMDMKGMDMSH